MPDSYRSRWSGMAFHSFLQRRSAPRKMVHLPSLAPVLFYNDIPDRIFPSFKNDGRQLLPFQAHVFLYIFSFLDFHVKTLLGRAELFVFISKRRVLYF